MIVVVGLNGLGKFGERRNFLGIVIVLSSSMNVAPPVVVFNIVPLPPTIQPVLLSTKWTENRGLFVPLA